MRSSGVSCSTLTVSLALLLGLSACVPVVGELGMVQIEPVPVALDGPCGTDWDGESVSVLGATKKRGELLVEVGYGTGCGSYATFHACEAHGYGQTRIRITLDTDNDCEAEGFTRLTIPMPSDCTGPWSIESSAVALSCD